MRKRTEVRKTKQWREPLEKQRAKSAQSVLSHRHNCPSKDKEQRWEAKKEIKRKTKKGQGTQESEPRETEVDPGS